MSERLEQSRSSQVPRCQQGPEGCYDPCAAGCGQRGVSQAHRRMKRLAGEADRRASRCISRVGRRTSPGSIDPACRYALPTRRHDQTPTGRHRRTERTSPSRCPSRGARRPPRATPVSPGQSRASEGCCCPSGPADRDSTPGEPRGSRQLGPSCRGSAGRPNLPSPPAHSHG